MLEDSLARYASVPRRKAPQGAKPAPTPPRTDGDPHAYRIRLADGFEVVLPSAEELQNRVVQGDVRPDTMIFDAGRAVWCRAAEAPVVQFIVEEMLADRQDALRAWLAWTSSAAASGAPLPADRPPASPTAVSQAPPPAAPPHLAAASTPAAAPLSPTAPPAAPRPAETSHSAETSRPAEGTTPSPARPAPGARPAKAIQPPAAPRPAHAAPVAGASPAPGAVPTAHRAAGAPAPVPAAPLAASPAAVPDAASSAAVGLAAPDGDVPSTAGVDLRTVGARLAHLAQQTRLGGRGMAVTALIAGGGVLLLAGVLVQGRRPAEAEAAAPAAPAPVVVTTPVVPTTDTRNVPPVASPPAGEAPPTNGSGAAAQASLPALAELTLPETLDVGSFVPGDDRLEPLPPPPLPERGAPSEEPPALTRLPQVRNLARVQEALEREYPIGLREAGIGGRVQLLFWVDREGRVERVAIDRSSGNSELDLAALRVARAFEFTPGMSGVVPTAATASFAISFGGSGG